MGVVGTSECIQLLHSERQIDVPWLGCAHAYPRPLWRMQRSWLAGAIPSQGAIEMRGERPLRALLCRANTGESLLRRASHGKRGTLLDWGFTCYLAQYRTGGLMQIVIGRLIDRGGNGGRICDQATAGWLAPSRLYVRAAVR